MAIQINDLPLMEDISEAEAKGVFGGSFWSAYKAGQSGAAMRRQGMKALGQARNALRGALKTVDNVMSRYSRESSYSARILDSKMAGMKRTISSLQSSSSRSFRKSKRGSSSS